MEDVGEMQVRRVDLYDGKTRVLGVGEAGGFGVCIDSAITLVIHGVSASCPKLLIKVSTQQYALSRPHSVHVSMDTVMKCRFSEGPKRKKLLCSTPRKEKTISNMMDQATKRAVVHRLSSNSTAVIIHVHPFCILP